MSEGNETYMKYAAYSSKEDDTVVQCYVIPVGLSSGENLNRLVY